LIGEINVLPELYGRVFVPPSVCNELQRAPSAVIVLASCADTNTNFGELIAVQNLLTGPGRPPAIISISYLESESYLGSTFNAYINQL